LTPPTIEATIDRMTIQPTAFGGRKIPYIDWEGDDHRSGDQFVTCGDSSLAMAAAWASNGRIKFDGSVFRASDPAPAGVEYSHLATELTNVSKGALQLVVPKGWTWGNCSFNSVNGTGLIVMGPYSALPAPYREQIITVDFWHYMFICYRSLASGMRLLDPLNKAVTTNGKWVPAAALRSFIEAGGVQVAYIKNQPI
jgi:hypothetical protein